MTNLTIEETDDIDITLTLNTHGWSSCFLTIKHTSLEFLITHIFNNPYLDLIKALSDLIEGQNNASFVWHDEPGGSKFDIARIMTEQHKVIVSVIEFSGWSPAESELQKLKVSFQIKLKQLITIFYFQLLKTQVLLKDREFAKNRSGGFPFQEFHSFERLVKPFIGH